MVNNKHKHTWQKFVCQGFTSNLFVCLFTSAHRILKTHCLHHHHYYRSILEAGCSYCPDSRLRLQIVDLGSESERISEVNRLTFTELIEFGLKSSDGRCHYYYQPPMSTQPGHPFVGRRNEYQPKGSDALRLGSKGRYGSCVGGR